MGLQLADEIAQTWRYGELAQYCKYEKIVQNRFWPQRPNYEQFGLRFFKSDTIYKSEGKKFREISRVFFGLVLF